jgi:polyphosphate kinase 2 (PPK2 family)
MLENVNLKRKLSAEEFSRVLPGLQRRIYDLEKACWDNKVSSIIVFEGWDAAGKGTAVSTLTQRLDPRGFKLHPIGLPRAFEQSRPWLWRFWLCVPNAGEMAIFDQSWYIHVLQERVEGLVPEKQWRTAFRDIVDFERMMADNGTVMIKFFLHISRKEQEKRFHAIAADPLESWRVTKQDWARHKKYNEYFAAAEEMLEITETTEAPWTIIEATSKRWALAQIFRTIIVALEDRLGPDAPPRSTSMEAEAADADLRNAMAWLDDSGAEDA